MYKLINPSSIVRISDGATIPSDQANNDYADYLKWIAAGNTPIPVDIPTLEQAKAEQIVKINQAADAAFDAITSIYPKQEVATWPNQYAEAQNLQANPQAATPTLTAIALEAGITVDSLKTSVLQKAAAFTQASGKVVGKRKKLTDQINAATTNAAVVAVVW